MKVFIRCEFCQKKCEHRREVNKTTGDVVDGCIVTEGDFHRYANWKEKNRKERYDTK